MDRMPEIGATGWTPLPQVVARRLQQKIVGGAWKPGHKLPSQRALSEEFSISRASLREALLTLETLGLIRTEPGRGTFVTYGVSLAPAETATWRFGDLFPLRDVFETRMIVEGHIAASAAGRIGKGGLAQLAQATDEMEGCWDRGDLLANVEADIRFHRMIAAACANSMLRSLYQTVSDLLTETQRQPIPQTETARMHASIAEHRALIDALGASDPQAAQAAMERHIRNTALCAGVTV